ncbi:alpha/beta hydrolase family protein [Methylomonas sp. 2BW1-5-20]|uniref:alpha/beta hydrolase family protein n=1 Tax=Methylomonas sp. 2BW1-5-20 TaxID=3376686 RepID=UPI00404D8336
MTVRIVLAVVLIASCAYIAGAKTYPMLYNWLHPATVSEPFNWPDGFTVWDIPSSVDGNLQKAYFYSAPGVTKRPLLISLHFWAGDYATPDPLAAYVKMHGWNYIHPDFRGPNIGTNNCLSDKVIADLDDAIEFALQNSIVDTQNIFVVGFSGGAYATLGWYAKTRHPVKAWLAWAAISDLETWQRETASHGHIELSENVLRCTGSGSQIDVAAARRRSPLYWTLPNAPHGRIELYAGIKDGHKGTVPISHSIGYFNTLMNQYGRFDAVVDLKEAMPLLTQGAAPTSLSIGDRTVFLRRDIGFAALTVFNGGHEMLHGYCFEHLLELAR